MTLKFYAPPREPKSKPDQPGQYPNNLYQLPLPRKPHVPKYVKPSTIESKMSTKNKRITTLGTVAVGLLIILLAKYGSPEKANIVKAQEEYANGEVPIEQIAQEFGIEDMMFYDGTITLKPGCTLRSSPEVIDEDDYSNRVTKSSNDPDNPTTANKSIVVNDPRNPENKEWLGVTLDSGEKVWVNWRNVVEFDKEQIKHVNIQTPEEQ